MGCPFWIDHKDAPMTSKLIPESEQQRDLYALYGAAMHTAQVLEHGIVNAMFMIMMNDRHHFTKRDFNAIRSKHPVKTIATLVSLLNAEVPCPDNLEDLLSVALAERSFLAFRFFGERNDQMSSAVGRAKTGALLLDDIDLFKSADAALEDTVKPFRERYGVTDERIDKMMHEMEHALIDPDFD